MTKLVRSPELAELRAFCAAVDLGSIGRAARLLRVSQPSLSKRLRGLEAIAGAPLLERSPRGVTPTAAGARLHTEARKLIADAESVEMLMSGLGELDEAPIRVAASPTITEFVLPGPLVEFESLHAHHVSVELFVANSYVVRDLVRDGRAEIGIAAQASGSGEGAPLSDAAFCEDEIVVAVPEEHPWAAAGEIELTDLVETPMVMRDPDASSRRIVSSVLSQRGLSLAPPLAEIGSTGVAKATALSECAPLLISSLAVGDGDERLVVRPVRGLRFQRRFVLLFGSEGSLRNGARALADHLLGKSPGTRGANGRPRATQRSRS